MAKRGKYGQGRVYQPRYKTPDGKVKIVRRWYIQFYDSNGRQHRESTNAPTELEARKILTQRMADASQGKMPTDRNLRYADLRAALISYYQIHKKKSLEFLTSTGKPSLRGLTKLDEFFGYSDADRGMRVSEITNALWVSGFIEARRKEGVSDATIRNSGAVLRQMFRIAASPEYKLVSPAQVPAFTLPKPPAPKKDFVTKEEFDKLLDNMPARFHPFMVFLFFQATRKMEAASIAWGQLDLSESVFYPNPENNKTGDDTPRPLADEVVAALKKLKQGKPDDLVFALHSQKMFQKAFRKAALKTGLGRFAWQCGQCKFTKDGPAPGPDDPAIACDACKKRSKGTSLAPMQYHYVGLSIHGLRRSTVVYYRESGFADSEIMSISGHRSNKTFLGYSQSRIAQLRKRLAGAAKERQNFIRKQEKLLTESRD